MTAKTVLEMYAEMVGRGYAVPAPTEPSRLNTPTAYVSLPTTLAFATPPIQAVQKAKASDAKLGVSPKRNATRKRRSGR
jgi:hypothetical protein